MQVLRRLDTVIYQKPLFPVPPILKEGLLLPSEASDPTPASCSKEVIRRLKESTPSPPTTSTLRLVELRFMRLYDELKQKEPMILGTFTIPWTDRVVLTILLRVQEQHGGAFDRESGKAKHESFLEAATLKIALVELRTEFLAVPGPTKVPAAEDLLRHVKVVWRVWRRIAGEDIEPLPLHRPKGVKKDKVTAPSPVEKKEEARMFHNISTNQKYATRLRQKDMVALQSLLPSPVGPHPTLSEASTLFCCGRPPGTVECAFLVQCALCEQWLHNTCCKMPTRMDVPPNYICLTCERPATDEEKRDRPQKRPRSPDAQPLPAPVLKSDEVEEMHGLLKQLEEYVDQKTPYHFVTLDKETSTLVKAGCLEACREAVKLGTFSSDYPKYCIRHFGCPMTFAAAIVEKSNPESVMAWVFTHGQDSVANFKWTLSQLRALRTKHRQLVTPTMELFMSLGECNLEEFVHINLLATHPECRRRGLGRLLILYAMLHWVATHKMTRAYLNMALEKDEFNVCFPSKASLTLYDRFDFVEVYPKYTESGDFRCTATESSTGRLMANLDVRDALRRVAAQTLNANA